MSQSYSFMGKGKINLGLEDQSGGLFPIGNASQLEISVDEDTKDQIDYESPGGGLANSISSITGVTADITALQISPDNLALGLRSLNTIVTSGVVVDEVVKAFDGALIPFEFIPDLTVDPVIKDFAGATTYVKDTDYTLTGAGIISIVGGSLGDNVDIKVSYTRLPGTVVEALTDSDKEYRLVFDGFNEAESGKPVIVTIHRIKFSPTQGLSLIGDDFGELPLSLAVLKSARITGTGLSKYIKIAMAS